MQQDFEGTMSKQSNVTLLKIIKASPGDYQTAAVEAAQKELQLRNLSVDEINLAEVKIKNETLDNERKESSELEIYWKFLCIILPGIIPLIVAGGFKSDGYIKKANQTIRWTLYGVGFYFLLLLFFFIIS